MLTSRALCPQACGHLFSRLQRKAVPLRFCLFSHSHNISINCVAILQDIWGYGYKNYEARFEAGKLKVSLYIEKHAFSDNPDWERE
jgi:hypothetical protein